jgi:hypothetical protein
MADQVVEGSMQQHPAHLEQLLCQAQAHNSTAVVLQTAATACAIGAMASGLHPAAVLQEAAL